MTEKKRRQMIKTFHKLSAEAQELVFRYIQGLWHDHWREDDSPQGEFAAGVRHKNHH